MNHDSYLVLPCLHKLEVKRGYFWITLKRICLLLIFFEALSVLLQNLALLVTLQLTFNDLFHEPMYIISIQYCGIKREKLCPIKLQTWIFYCLLKLYDLWVPRTKKWLECQFLIKNTSINKSMFIPLFTNNTLIQRTVGNQFLTHYFFIFH